MPKIKNWKRLQSRENGKTEYLWKNRETGKTLVVKSRKVYSPSKTVYDIKVGKDTVTDLGYEDTKSDAYQKAVKWMKSHRYEPRESNWRQLTNEKWVNDETDVLLKIDKNYSSDTYKLKAWSKSRNVHRTVRSGYDDKYEAREAARKWRATHQEPDWMKLQDNPKTY